VAALALEDVTKRYADVLALDGVSLSIDPSGFHCLLGPNGSGKTTTIRLLLGLERPTAGLVVRDGVRLGSGFQQPSFYPSLSVRENLAVFEAAIDRDLGAWHDRLVTELDLEPVLGRPAADLSGGFARKLDLALALLARPDVVLLDEPLGALDDVSTARILPFLAEYCEAGNAVVVSTHEADAFEPYADRVTVLHQGQVLDDRERAAIDLASDESLQSRYVEAVLARERDESGTDRDLA